MGVERLHHRRPRVPRAAAPVFAANEIAAFARHQVNGTPLPLAEDREAVVPMPRRMAMRPKAINSVKLEGRREIA
jgi:hypothetical protein